MKIAFLSRTEVNIGHLTAGLAPHPVTACRTKEALLDEHIEAGGRLIRIFALVLVDGPRVLLAAEDELFFLLAPNEMRPGRERDAEHDGHDRHRHEERDHHVSGA